MIDKKIGEMYQINEKQRLSNQFVYDNCFWVTISTQSSLYGNSNKNGRSNV